MKEIHPKTLEHMVEMSKSFQEQSAARAVAPAPAFQMTPAEQTLAEGLYNPLNRKPKVK